MGGDLGSLAKASGDVSGRSVAEAIEQQIAQSPPPELPLPSTFLRSDGTLEQVRWVESASGPALEARISGELGEAAKQLLTDYLKSEQQ